MEHRQVPRDPTFHEFFKNQISSGNSNLWPT
jgi:hypothetical protein